MEEKKDYYHLLKHPARFIADVQYSRVIKGVDNIPEEPAIYAANHLRAIDSVLMALAYTDHTGNAMRFGAKQEYFDGKGIDNKGKLGRFAKWMVESTHQIPVVRDRGTREDFARFSDAIEAAVARGDSIGLHPEGTRSPDGRLYTFRQGVAKIALEQSIPIVPVGITYSEPLINYRQAVVEFGEPIDIEEYSHLPKKLIPGGMKVRQVSEQVEQRVADLTGQERAHMLADIYNKEAS